MGGYNFESTLSFILDIETIFRQWVSIFLTTIISFDFRACLNQKIVNLNLFFWIFCWRIPNLKEKQCTILIRYCSDIRSRLATSFMLVGRGEAAWPIGRGALCFRFLNASFPFSRNTNEIVVSWRMLTSIIHRIKQHLWWSKERFGQKHLPRTQSNKQAHKQDESLSLSVFN